VSRFLSALNHTSFAHCSRHLWRLQWHTISSTLAPCIFSLKDSFKLGFRILQVIRE
jgi:hypothetical protein